MKKTDTNHKSDGLINEKPNITRLQEIENIAAEWFLLIDSDDCSEADKQHFLTWLDESPDHVEAYQALASIWDEASSLPLELFTRANNESEQNEACVVTEKTTGQQNSLRSLRMRLAQWWQPYYSVAFASLFLFAFLLSQFYISTDQDEYSYSTAIAEVRTVTLADGSMVTLGADSNMNYVETASSRTATLIKGQAFFDIRKRFNKNNEKIPFFVNIKDAQVEVVGTQFDVKLLPSRSFISVIEGQVNVSSSDNSISLNKDQRAIISDTGLLQKTDISAIDGTGSWRAGYFSYTDAPLAEIIDDIQRYHTGRITISSKALEHQRITTSFTVANIPDMVAMLEVALPIRVEIKKNGRILILPKNK